MVKKWARPGIDHFELGADALTHVVGAATLLADGLARTHQVRQPEHALEGECRHNSCQ
jgi:hypothetical protein